MRMESSRQPAAGRQAIYVVAILVAVATFLCYLPALRGEFLIWDDPFYVVNNRHIRSVNLEFLTWTFTSAYGSWHPVTWISYALDYLLWGMSPLGYHLTSIIYHSLNSLLVVLLTVRLLECAKRSNELPSILDGDGILIAGGVVGVLFGLHPLHVESVAWISDRKDLLCAFFFLCSLLSYLKYIAGIQADAGSPAGNTLLHYRQYILCLSFFLLALASKGIAVALTPVLLILDYYPFSRFSCTKGIRAVLLEKIPFFLLSLLITVIGFLGQKNLGALASYNFLTLPERTLTALRAAAFYLWKLAVPVHIIPFYPHPDKITIFDHEYLLGSVTVVGLSILLVCMRQQNKVLLCAWSYYLLTLLPVSGIVPVGIFSMADRFTYLPSLGPFLLVGLATAWLWSKAGSDVAVRRAIVAIGTLCFLMMSILLIRQIKVWNNSVRLWSYVIEKGPYEIPLAYSNRGMAYLEQGEYEKAIADCTKALAIQPDYHLAYYNRGKAYLLGGSLSLAMADLNRTIVIAPKYAEAYALRGEIFSVQGDLAPAISDYSTAIDLNPEMYEVYLNRGIAYKESGDYVRAIEDYNRTLALVPDSPEAFNSRGVANRYLGRLEQALADYSRSIALNPQFALAYCNRGIVHKEMKNYELAVADFNRATALSPDLIKAYLEAGYCYRLLGRSDLAAQEFQAACDRRSAEGCTALSGLGK
jgi:tetratricopeptide (TPR) repeat protein